MKPALFAAVIAVGAACCNGVHGSELVPVGQLPAGAYKLDLSHASLTWKVSHLGLSDYTARFAKFDAELTLSPGDMTKSSVVVTVDPKSIRTDYPYASENDFDKKLSMSDEWFNAGTHPLIRFTSTRIEKTGDKTFDLHGDLTLLGVTKPVVLRGRLNGAYLAKPFSDVAAVGFSATGEIKRSDWGLDAYIPSIGDKVALQIEAEFHQVD
jgi:polyisoprenoid-binding protein YceI